MKYIQGMVIDPNYVLLSDYCHARSDAYLYVMHLKVLQSTWFFACMHTIGQAGVLLKINLVVSISLYLQTTYSN